MRAAILRNGGIIVGDMAEPIPGPGQVLVRTLACGICGTDVRVLHKPERLTPLLKHVPWRRGMDMSKDIALGHEFCCEVLDFGPECARRIRPGARVVSLPYTIVNGAIERIGYSHVNVGGFAERMVLSEETLIEVPDHLSSIHAAYTEPLAAGLNAVNRAGFEGSEVPLVIGCGPIGLAVIIGLAQLRKRLNIGPIIASDPQPKRRIAAQMAGADYVVDPGRDSPYRTWELHARERREFLTPLQRSRLPPMSPRRAQSYRQAVIFDCAGAPGVMQSIYEGAAQNARIIAVGVTMLPDHIEPLIGANKELEVRYVLNSTASDFERAFDLLASGEADASMIVTGVVGLDGVGGAIKMLSGRSDHIKIAVEPWREETMNDPPPARSEETMSFSK